MKQKLIDLLETFGYPVSLQGSYEEDAALPESFITFWNYETNLVYADNEILTTEYVYRVFFYSTNKTLVNSVLNEVRKLLLKHNFHCSGDYDIESGIETYDGREMEIRYLKKEDN